MADGSMLIDLRSQRVGRDKNYRIHEDALHKIFTLLSETPRLGKDRDQEREESLFNHRDQKRIHDAITVTAPRGSGKTTFLLSVLDAISADKKLPESWCQTLNQKSESLPKLYPLGIIDPTLIETKQHIMVLILDLIWDAVKQQKDIISRNRHESGSFGKKLKDCEDKLHRCARGLGLLDGIGEEPFGKDWMDADFILDQGLENASAATGFARDFSEFVEAALDALGRDAFVLAIDDIDTRFERGWPVLEAIRKYLTSPHLRIILSGDINLYSLLVRRQQWEQIGDPLLKPEQWLHEKMSASRQSLLPRVAAMVDQLQEQYLTKVLPTENRIELRTLADHVDRGKLPNVKIDDGDPRPLDVTLNFYADHILGFRAEGHKAVFRSAILRQALRTIIQAMRAARGVLSASWNAKSIDAEARSDAIDGLRHVAWTAMFELGLRPDETQERDPRRLLLALAQWISERKDWKILPRLSPDSLASDMNLAVLAVNASLFDGFRRDPGAMFEYCLKISQIRSLVEMGVAGDGLDLAQHANLLNPESVRRTVARIGAWSMRGTGREITRRASVLALPVPVESVRNYNAAMIELYGVRYSGAAGVSAAEKYPLFDPKWIEDDSAWEGRINNLPDPIRYYYINDLRDYTNKNKKIKYINGLFNSINSAINSVDDASRNVISILFYRVYSDQGASNGAVSFLRVIGFMAELLSVFGKGGELKEDDVKKHVKLVLSEAIAQEEYAASGMSPSDDETFGGGSSGRARAGKSSRIELSDLELDVEDDEGAGSNDGLSDKLSDPLVHVLTKWLLFWGGKDVSVAPVVLDRVWSRFIQTANAIDQNVMTHLGGRYLGWLMHRYTVAFLHACGTELCVRDEGSWFGNFAKNPVKSSDDFVKFMNEYLSKKVKISNSGDFFSVDSNLFDMVFTFPVWNFLICEYDDNDEFLGSAVKARYEKLYNMIYEVKGSTVRAYTDDKSVWESDAGIKLSSILNSIPILDQKSTGKPERGLFVPSVETPDRGDTPQKKPRGRPAKASSPTDQGSDDFV